MGGTSIRNCLSSVSTAHNHLGKAVGMHDLLQPPASFKKEQVGMDRKYITNSWFTYYHCSFENSYLVGNDIFPDLLRGRSWRLLPHVLTRLYPSSEFYCGVFYLHLFRKKVIQGVFTNGQHLLFPCKNLNCYLFTKAQSHTLSFASKYDYGSSVIYLFLIYYPPCAFL